jgi:hypothetical protein
MANKLNIRQKLSKIQQEIKVNKSQYNAFGKYYYRSAEDILEAIKPYELKYDVLFTVNDTMIPIVEAVDTPLVYIQSLATIMDCETEESLSVSGQALIDFQAKGMQMPQRTGAASSYAKKYALGNLLLLDDTKDPDGTNTHGKDLAKAPAKPATARLKAMTPEEAKKFNTAIVEGKFAQVEKYLPKYADSMIKEDVLKALTDAKSGILKK